LKHSTDIIIKATKENGLNQDGRIILSHIQPIAKSALEKQFGRFADDEWRQIIAHHVSNIDRNYPEEQ
jgi:mRNA-degrading endonuclease toxin of MazEF toxin-antitoxin module